MLFNFYRVHKYLLVKNKRPLTGVVSLQSISILLIIITCDKAFFKEQDVTGEERHREIIRRGHDLRLFCQ